MINSWITKEQFVFVDFVIAVEVLILFFVLLLRLYTVLRALLWRTQIDFDEPLNPTTELSTKTNEQLRHNVNITTIQDVYRAGSQPRKARASRRSKNLKGTVTPKIKTKFRSRSCSPDEDATNNSCTNIDASENCSRKSSVKNSRNITVLCSRQKIFKEDVESGTDKRSQKLDKKNGKFINGRKEPKSSTNSRI